MYYIYIYIYIYIHIHIERERELEREREIEKYNNRLYYNIINTNKLLILLSLYDIYFY